MGRFKSVEVLPLVALPQAAETIGHGHSPVRSKVRLIRVAFGCSLPCHELEMETIVSRRVKKTEAEVGTEPIVSCSRELCVAEPGSC